MSQYYLALMKEDRDDDEMVRVGMWPVNHSGQGEGTNLSLDVEPLLEKILDNFGLDA